MNELTRHAVIVFYGKGQCGFGNAEGSSLTTNGYNVKCGGNETPGASSCFSGFPCARSGRICLNLTILAGFAEWESNEPGEITGTLEVSMISLCMLCSSEGDCGSDVQLRSGESRGSALALCAFKKSLKPLRAEGGAL